ncbi:class I SAM-dependent methyltransferase [Paracoccaceae bacterium Fryx2]|nr:class I SAM-dependent methyltransferase [Paracoccaceae bacterium Fryx2]
MAEDLEEYRAAANRIEEQLAQRAQDCARLIVRPATQAQRAALLERIAGMTDLRRKLGSVFNFYNMQCMQFVHAQPGPAVPPVLVAPTPGKPDLPLPRFFEGVGWRLRMMNLLADQLVRIAEDHGQPLYAPPPPLWDMASQQLDALNRVHRSLHRLLNPLTQNAEARDYGCYPDIPLNTSVFLEHAHAARRVAMAQGRAGPLRFLDVGCGIGITLLLAAQVFDRPDGLEYDPGYADAASQILRVTNAARCRIILDDALTFQSYAAYDVIYFYQPMDDAALLERLERRIIAQARPGTILIAPYDYFGQRAEDYDCSYVAGSIWITGRDDAAAADLRALAESYGTSLVPPDTRPDPREGFLEPVLSACRAINFHIG